MQAPLLPLDAALSTPPPPEATPAWRALHAGAFLLGGTTFIAGTAAL
jgi:hypothetical protein